MKGPSPPPVVSVVLATYNRGGVLPRAVASVLRQRFRSWELLVLDDASTDDTPAVMAPFLDDERIRYLPQRENLGIAGNRNRAFAVARGRYVAPIDSDDEWLDEEKLTRQTCFLDTHADHGLVGTWAILTEDSKKKHLRFACDDRSIRMKMLRRNQFAHSAVLYRRDLIERTGGYDTSLPLCVDYDLWLRIGMITRFANLPYYTVRYNRNPDSVTLSEGKKRAEKTVLAVIRRYRRSYPLYRYARVRVLLRLLKFHLLSAPAALFDRRRSRS